jgi:transcriptional regulator with XRE-family HTH domain
MLNKALKEIRLFHQLKQDELSKKLDISKSYLSELEAGKKTISLEILDKYSKVFSIPTSSLLLFSENLDSKPSSKSKVNFANKILKLIEWVNLRDDINREA